MTDDVEHDPEQPDARKRWYFTFGIGQENAGRYVVVDNATFAEARDRMITAFGRAWAFQYDDEQWHRDGVSQKDRYGLTELRFPEQPARPTPLTGGELEARLRAAGVAATVTIADRREVEEGAFDTLTLHLPDGDISIDASGEHAYDLWLEAEATPAPDSYLARKSIGHLVTAFGEAAVDAAYNRLRPYLNGYPQPMIDTRRLRIANGTATPEEARDVRVEDALIWAWKEAGLLPGARARLPRDATPEKG